MKKIKNLFTEDVQKILTDETLTAIEEAIETKVNLAVTEALDKQDQEYATQLQTLVTTIDEDHSKKMQRVLESFDKSTSAKLLSVVKKYERDQNVELKNFKKTMVESVGSFLDEFINETISKEDLKQAVENKAAFRVVEHLRDVLAVDSVMMKESITSAILEGKEEMSQIKKENEDLKKKLQTLNENYDQSKKNLLLESKISKFPEDKKSFIKKALQDKSLKFIEENFDYTLRLFDKQDKRNLQTLKEAALVEREHKPDFVPQKVVEEKVNKNNTNEDPYVSELEKVRKF